MNFLNSGFLGFLKKKGGLWILVLAVSVGLFLLVYVSGSEQDVSDETSEISELCSSVEGVGECRVMITYEGGEPVGIVVVCRGGDSVQVRHRLYEMLSALYGIGANRISIEKMK